MATKKDHIKETDTPIETSKKEADVVDSNGPTEEKVQESLEKELDAALSQAQILLESEPHSETKNPDENKEDESTNDTVDKEISTMNNDLNTKVPNRDQQIRSLKNRVNLLSLCLLVSIGTVGYGSFYFNEHKFDDINDLKAQLTQSAQNAIQAESKINVLFEKIQEKDQRVSELLASNDELKNQNNVLKNNEDNLKKLTDTAIASSEKINIRLNKFESRNPNDWLIAQSFFLVSNAQNLLSFSDNLNAVVLNLTNADLMLVRIDEPQINQIREALNRDILALKSISQIDYKGLFYKLDSVYNNVDTMPLNEFLVENTNKYSTTKEQNVKTDDVANWKENLIVSLKEFSSRFIEIRRRDETIVNQFLSPDQTNILLQNIKTELLLAKIALFNRDQAGFSKNIQDIITHVSAYYDVNNATVKTNIEVLNELKEIKIINDNKKSLESFPLFNTVAKERFNLYKVQKTELKDSAND